MTGTTFLVSAMLAAVVTLAVAWAWASQHVAVPRPVDQARAVDERWPASNVAVSVAYRAAIARARQLSTGQLLATDHALRHRKALSADELLEWAAAHHVLVTERGVTPHPGVGP